MGVYLVCMFREFGERFVGYVLRLGFSMVHDASFGLVNRGYLYPDDVARIYGDALKDLLQEYGGKTVLDLGSGSSTGVAFLAPEDAEVIRLDLDEDMDIADYYFDLHLRSRSFEKPEYRNIVADARDMPLEDNSVDLVVACGVLQEGENDIHVGYSETGIERVLKPGGDLVMASLNLEEREAGEHLEEVGIDREKFEEVEKYGNVLRLKRLNVS